MKIKRTIFLALITALAFAACKSGPTPADAFKAYFEAQKKKDVAGMKQLLSKSSLAMMEGSAKVQGITVDKMIEGQLAHPSAKVDKVPEIRNEKIDGDSATIELRNDDANRWDTMYFVKEDSKWKIALDRTVEELLRKTGS